MVCTFFGHKDAPSNIKMRLEEIIEIGAVKIQNGMTLDSFQTFVNPVVSKSKTT